MMIALLVTGFAVGAAMALAAPEAVGSARPKQVEVDRNVRAPSTSLRRKLWARALQRRAVARRKA